MTFEASEYFFSGLDSPSGQIVEPYLKLSLQSGELFGIVIGWFSCVRCLSRLGHGLPRSQKMSLWRFGFEQLADDVGERRAPGARRDTESRGDFRAIQHRIGRAARRGRILG